MKMAEGLGLVILAWSISVVLWYAISQAIEEFQFRRTRKRLRRRLRRRE